MGRYIVKFVPYNLNTISSLITKQVKFSTVREFNDFNELCFIPYENNFESKTREHLKDRYMTLNIDTMIKALSCADYTKDYLDGLKSRIKCFNPKTDTVEQEDLPSLFQYMIWDSVGIFCCSDIKIFNSNNAAVMFAHYADNLQGLALIFQRNNISQVPFKEVEYDVNACTSSYQVNSPLSWLGYNYTEDMYNFSKKYKVWKYEQEYRLFCKPGLHSMPNVGLELKAILYTDKFDQYKLTVLNELNSALYGGKIVIEKVSPDNTPGGHAFYVKDKNQQPQNVYDWISSLPPTNPPSP